jgi:hypothetical protein
MRLRDRELQFLKATRKEEMIKDRAVRASDQPSSLLAQGSRSRSRNDRRRTMTKFSPANRSSNGPSRALGQPGCRRCSNATGHRRKPRARTKHSEVSDMRSWIRFNRVPLAGIVAAAGALSLMQWPRPDRRSLRSRAQSRFVTATRCSWSVTGSASTLTPAMASSGVSSRPGRICTPTTARSSSRKRVHAIESKLMGVFPTPRLSRCASGSSRWQACCLSTTTRSQSAEQGKRPWR